MTQFLLSVPRVQYVLSDKLYQYTVEAFFGKQRAAGGWSDNPTVQQSCFRTVSLHAGAGFSSIRTCLWQLRKETVQHYHV